MKKGLIVLSGVIVVALTGAPGAIATASPSQSASHATRKAERDAAKDLTDAKFVINKMKMDTHVRDLLKESKGVLLVPNYGRGAIVGVGSGDEGLLMAHYHGDWSDPVFYHVGAINTGVRTGMKGERVAMILMTDKAIQHFKAETSFSLNGDSGLAVVDYSKRNPSSDAKADVVLWSDTHGASGGTSVNASTISADENTNRAYYGDRYASPKAILAGVSERRPAAAALRHDLPA